ncbi:MAG: DUF4418 family protein [Chloroflexi bacterium]|nr:DUF4418 family protein [Chloroflexota bacterium]
MKKVLSISLIVLALGIAVIPLFTDCESQGRHLTLQNGSQVPMKCHWTAIAEIGVGITLGLTGFLMLRSKQKETDRSLSALGVTSGALAILFPTALIGVCANPTMICNMIMRPTMILAGTLAIAISLGLLLNTRKLEVAV